MNDAEKEAQKWLETWTMPSPYRGHEHARVIKAMLARPVMPEELPPDMIEYLREVFVQARGDYCEGLRTVWREARRQLMAASESETGLQRQVRGLQAEVQRLRVAYKLNMGQWPPDAPEPPR